MLKSLQPYSFAAHTSKTRFGESKATVKNPNPPQDTLVRFGQIKGGYQFTSDNCAPTDPRYMQALMDANRYDDTYGHDKSYSPRAKAMVEAILGQGTTIGFVNNGTVANTILLQSFLDSSHAVIGTDIAHINSRAAGSVESNIGARIIALPNVNGKLTVDALKSVLEPAEGKRNFTKIQQPKAITISQPTELGSVYTQKEIKALTDYAHSKGMLVHMDGARLLNAAASNTFKDFDNPLKAMTTDAGVDTLYWGFTKNNMDTVELAVFLPGFFENYPKLLLSGRYLTESNKFHLDRTPANDFDRQFEVRLKQQGTLSAKGPRDAAAQLIVGLQNKTALNTAKHANQMASLLAEQLRLEVGPNIVKYAPDTNVVILSLPLPIVHRLEKENVYKRLKIMAADPETKGNGLLRLTTHGMTTSDEVQDAIQYFKQLYEKDGKRDSLFSV